MSALLNLSTQNHVQYVRPDAGGNARSPIITIIIMTIYSMPSTRYIYKIRIAVHYNG